MKTVFDAKTLNVYRSKVPKGYYNAIKGHTGIDLSFIFENLFSPVTGKVVGVTEQLEMGHCLYIKDVWSNIHVFAHLRDINVKMYDEIKREQLIAVTGNTGSKSTAPHLHYEIITQSPWTDSAKGGNWINRIMSRSLWGFNGYNADPILYDRYLYKFHGVPIE